jgi:hypothetical protein
VAVSEDYGLNPVITIFTEYGGIVNDFDSSPLIDYRLLDLKWLDNENLIMMFTDSEATILKVYSLSIFAQNINALELLWDIPYGVDIGWRRILRVP